MRRRPRIEDARTLAKELGARAVVVVALDRDGYAVTSYGATVAECRDVARLTDAIADGIALGRLWSWDGAPTYTASVGGEWLAEAETEGHGTTAIGAVDAAALGFAADWPGAAPRVEAVVCEHHGAAPTAATIIRRGRCSVLIDWTGDLPSWTTTPIVWEPR